jgi:apolipoprotein N-acyltransferase
MRSAALRLIALWGWRRLMLACMLGVLCAAAMAPLRLAPVLLIGFTLLVWLLDGAHAQARSAGHGFRTGFLVGLAFGIGYFLVGLHWIGAAFYVDAETFAWMMPVILGGLVVLLAAFWGAACGVAVVLWSGGAVRLVLLAAAFAGAEWLRGHVLTGFPWNTLGYAVAASDALSQLAALGGVYALTFMVVLVAAAPALLGDDDDRHVAGLSAGTIGFGCIAALGGALWVTGYGLLSAPDDEGDAATRTAVRIVQPDIDQAIKWDPDYASEIFTTYLELSDTATSPQTSGIADVDVLVWPESALPFFLEESPYALAAIAALLPEHVTLLTGALRRTGTSEETQVFNSVLALDAEARTVARYDKFHLVPYGEYLPLEDLLARVGFRKLVTVPLGFSAGTAPVTLAVPGVPPFSPLVCYEIAFPRAVLDDSDRPEWLLNVTNDAWFGTTVGPRQHLQHARFRAIEEGLPVVRAANTGISAVIDARGRIVESLGQGQRGVIDFRLPAARAMTLYVRWGDWILAAFVAFGFTFGTAARILEGRPGRDAGVRHETRLG